jgi:hypothetical protein
MSFSVSSLTRKWRFLNHAVNTMHAPIGAFAAGFGNAGAIGHAYRTARPVQSLAGRSCRQQTGSRGGADRREELTRAEAAQFRRADQERRRLGLMARLKQTWLGE